MKFTSNRKESKKCPTTIWEPLENPVSGRFFTAPVFSPFLWKGRELWCEASICYLLHTRKGNFLTECVCVCVCRTCFFSKHCSTLPTDCCPLAFPMHFSEAIFCAVFFFCSCSVDCCEGAAVSFVLYHIVRHQRKTLTEAPCGVFYFYLYCLWLFLVRLPHHINPVTDHSARGGGCWNLPSQV